MRKRDGRTSCPNKRYLTWILEEYDTSPWGVVVNPKEPSKICIVCDAAATVR